jgi:hypothetical protein
MQGEIFSPERAASEENNVNGRITRARSPSTKEGSSLQQLLRPCLRFWTGGGVAWRTC